MRDYVLSPPHDNINVCGDLSIPRIYISNLNFIQSEPLLGGRDEGSFSRNAPGEKAIPARSPRRSPSAGGERGERGDRGHYLGTPNRQRCGARGAAPKPDDLRRRAYV